MPAKNTWDTPIKLENGSQSIIKSDPMSEFSIHQILHWIFLNEEILHENFYCIRCGKCCLIYAHKVNNLMADRDDLERWAEVLVEWRGKVYPMTRFVDYLFDFLEGDDKLRAGDLWFHPETHDELFRCPFLRKQRSKRLYTCLIHNITDLDGNGIKPNMCKGYPTDWHLIECKGMRQLIKEELNLKFHSVKEEMKFWTKLEFYLKGKAI